MYPTRDRWRKLTSPGGYLHYVLRRAHTELGDLIAPSVGVFPGQSVSLSVGSNNKRCSRTALVTEPEIESVQNPRAPEPIDSNSVVLSDVVIIVTMKHK